MSCEISLNICYLHKEIANIQTNFTRQLSTDGISFIRSESGGADCHEGDIQSISSGKEVSIHTWNRIHVASDKVLVVSNGDVVRVYDYDLNLIKTFSFTKEDFENFLDTPSDLFFDGIGPVFAVLGMFGLGALIALKLKPL